MDSFPHQSSWNYLEHVTGNHRIATSVPSRQVPENLHTSFAIRIRNRGDGKHQSQEACKKWLMEKLPQILSMTILLSSLTISVVHSWNSYFSAVISLVCYGLEGEDQNMLINFTFYCSVCVCVQWRVQVYVEAIRENQIPLDMSAWNRTLVFWKRRRLS